MSLRPGDFREGHCLDLLLVRFLLPASMKYSDEKKVIITILGYERL